MPKQALFVGLIFNEQGEPLEATVIGGEPYYAIPDDGFRRHVAARDVDIQIVTQLRDQMLAHREIVTEQILEMMGKDDLFTKAMIDVTLQNLDKQVDQMMEVGMPEDARMWLGMMGFRATVNVHGELVELNLPAQEMPDEE